MRLSLIAMVLALAAIVGTASAEANPYYGDNNDGRIERSHSNWTGKRRYSNRQYSQRRYSNHRSSHRQYAHVAIPTAGTHIAATRTGMRIVRAPSASTRSATTTVAARTLRAAAQ